MSDRELLEAAAKAAGIPVRFSDDGTCQHAEMQGNDSFRYWAPWNPLTDDGDALRLAVKLGIEVWFEPNEFNEVCAGAHSMDGWFSEELTQGNAEAATRRAITRAAASIGSGKESAS